MTTREKSPKSKHSRGEVAALPSTDEKGAIRYRQLVQELETVRSEKTAKKTISVLEELICIERHVEGGVLSVLTAMIKIEKVALQELLSVLLWKSSTHNDGHSITATRFDSLSKAAIEGAKSGSSPEVRRTAFTVILTLYLLQTISTRLTLSLPPEFVSRTVQVLQSNLEHKQTEKRGFASKTTWHEGKKIRLQSHLSTLQVFSKLFITQMFPVMSLSKNPKLSTVSVASIIIRTAIEYSYKEKDIPVVRESLVCLCQMAEVEPECVGGVAQYLPTEMRLILNNSPVNKDKDKRSKDIDGKDVVIHCWDPFTASALAKLCLAVLHKQGQEAAARSKFMRCLLQLFHYPKDLVFTDVVNGIVRRSGLFYMFLQKDAVYGGSETLLNYTVNRIQSLLKSGEQLRCNVGARLISAICEQCLANRHLLSDQTAAMTSLTSCIAPIKDELEKASFDPLLTVNRLKALTWLTAVVISTHSAEHTHTHHKVGLATDLLTTLCVTIQGSPLQSDLVLELLKCFIKSLRLLAPGPQQDRELLVPAFTGLIIYLIKNCIAKTSIQGIYNLLQDFLMNVDVLSAKRVSGAPALLDMDTIANQRAHGGVNTLLLILQVLDGNNAEQSLLSSSSDSSERDKLYRTGRLLIEVIRFTGDFGNVLVNSGPDCNGNMRSLLLRLRSLLYTQQNHIAWEIGLALLKIASRAVTHVRVAVYEILTSVCEARIELQSLLQPLVSIVDELLSLSESFEFAQNAASDPQALVDSATLAHRFFQQHEALKERLAVYVRFAELKRYKLLGDVSEDMLAQAFDYEKRLTSKADVEPVLMFQT